MKTGIKCGEIIWENEEFKFHCFLCNYSDDDLEQFGDHFYGSHFKELLNNSTATSTKEIIDPQNVTNSVDIFEENSTYKPEVVDNIKPEGLLNSSENALETVKDDADDADDDDNDNDNDYFQDGANDRDDDDDDDDDSDDGDNDDFNIFFKNDNASKPINQIKPSDGQIRKISKCGYCQREFVMRKFYLKHIWKWANTRFECSVCEAKICGLDRYNRHMKLAHNITRSKSNNEAIYYCDLCNGIYKSRAMIEQHMRVHNGDRPFPCKQCERQFTTKSALETHEKQHVARRTFPCNKCDKVFTFLRALSAHTNKSHPSPVGPLPCTICNKFLSNKTRLKVHMRTHSIERPFPCPTCGKKFKCRKTLASHITIHSEYKQFPCDYCEMRFNQSSGRRAHVRRIHEPKMDKIKIRSH